MTRADEVGRLSLTRDRSKIEPPRAECNFATGVDLTHLAPPRTPLSPKLKKNRWPEADPTLEPGGRWWGGRCEVTFCTGLRDLQLTFSKTTDMLFITEAGLFLTTLATCVKSVKAVEDIAKAIRILRERHDIHR